MTVLFLDRLYRRRDLAQLDQLIYRQLLACTFVVNARAAGPTNAENWLDIMGPAWFYT
jgi:hypothetical protein